MPTLYILGILETGIYAWAFLYTVLQLTWKNKSKDENDIIFIQENIFTTSKYSRRGISFHSVLEQI